VLPGTSLVDVVVRGTTTTGPNQYGLRIVTAGNFSADQVFAPRPSGQPFHIPVFPNEADPGHQQFSTWQFFIEAVSTNSLYDVTAPPAIVGNQVHVTVTIYKGVVPYEPAHPDFWQGRDHIELLHEKACTSGTVGAGYPEDLVCPFTPSKGAFVPPGTLEVRGRLHWTNPNGAPTGTAWVLAYKGADSVGDAGAFHAPSSTTPGSNAVDFVIKVKPGEVDQFYQSISYWRFWPDDGAAATPGLPQWGANTGYGTSWYLTATAVKDPAYVQN